MTVSVTGVDPFGITIDAEQSSKKIRVNFHDVFGTTGCLLQCNQRRTLQNQRTDTGQPRKELRKARIIANAAGQQQETLGGTMFGWDELCASISKGCGSCRVIREILAKVFSGQDMSKYQYSVSALFVTSRSRARPSTDDTLEETAVIPLFQPGELPIRFEGMPASDFLPGDTASDISSVRLSGWLKACEDGHDTCSVTSSDALPTRLVDTTDITRGQQHGVRVVQTSPGQTGTYVCLSHCWGTAEMPCRTTDETLQGALDFLDMALLPKNFRDAILITRRLGLHYIWIDSLCIIQGNAQDWDRESAKMAEIYRNAHLTIVSVASSDWSGGCFFTSKPDACLAIQSGPAEPRYLVGARMAGLGADTPNAVRDQYPILFRGWVFQERLLSRRLAFFNAGEVAFQCLEGASCECGNDRVSPHPGSGALSQITSVLGKSKQQRVLMAAAYPDLHLLDTSQLRKGQYNASDVPNEWRRMVAQYTSLNLTRHNDILTALSGCAKVIQGRMNDTYIAGMWRRSLAQDLLWTTVPTRPKVKSTVRLRPRNDPWTAPTWSWASLPPGQPIVFSNPPLNKSIVVTNFLRSSLQDVHCEPVAPAVAPFGEVEPGAHLKVRSRLVPCYVRQFCKFAKTWHVRYYELHETKARESGTGCHSTVEGLELQGGTMSSPLWDVPPVRSFIYNPFEECKGTVLPCALARVYLLRVEQRGTDNWTMDSFMILKTDGSGAGDSYGGRAFERVGVSYFEGHTRKQRDIWFTDIWDTAASSEEVFTIV